MPAKSKPAMPVLEDTMEPTDAAFGLDAQVQTGGDGDLKEFTIRFPRIFLARTDRARKELGFNTRTAFLRAAVEEYLHRRGK